MKAIDKLIQLLESPDEPWVFMGCTANLRDAVVVWIVNCPVLDTNTYPIPMDLSLRDKWRLWKAVKVARNNAWLRKLSEGDGDGK